MYRFGVYLIPFTINNHNDKHYSSEYWRLDILDHLWRFALKIDWEEYIATGKG